MHVLSDLAIAAAYIAISICLYQLVRAIRLPFSTMVLSFGVFIGACACTHLMEIWNLWHANYWYAGVVKALTALASGTTAFWLMRLRPQILHVAEAAGIAELRRTQLEEANSTLQQQAQALRQSNLRLAEQQKMMVQTAKMSALGEMAGGIAHEINSPLAIILIRAQQLQRSLRRGALALDAVSDEAELIANTAKRIGVIVEGLQAFAREGGDEPLQPIPIADVLRDALGLCQQRFAYQSIDLQVAAGPSGCCILARPVQICQVLLCLLNNAYDAVQHSEVRWVRVAVAADGADVSLTVTDSGAGIAPAIAQNIMMPFFTTKEVGKGTGLGLSIAQGIAQEHGGSLHVDTAAAHTCFVLRLPRCGAPADVANG